MYYCVSSAAIGFEWSLMTGQSILANSFGVSKCACPMQIWAKVFAVVSGQIALAYSRVLARLTAQASWPALQQLQ
jgi:hypothetical protein